MADLKIRQGVMVLHIDGEGKVIQYQISMAIPMLFNSSDAIIINKRKYVSKSFQTWKEAMTYKLALQSVIIEWKVEQLQKKRIDKLTRLSELYTYNL